MMTVLTQNIWGVAPLWMLRRKALASLIAKIRPDVIGLQEVHAHDPIGADSQAHELAHLTEGYEAIFAPARIEPSGRCEGVAVLSRHPVIDWQASPLTHDSQDALDRFGPRVVLHALVETPDGLVDAFVTHLSLSRQARSRTVPELLAFATRVRARSSSRGALLMGDLNAKPDEPTIGILEGGDGQSGSGWLDAWRSANGPGVRGATWPAIAPYRRIDYVFVQPTDRWVVDSCWRGAVTGSDHLGVVARLGLV
jgi:endonuclease/exonuclease/phosphatase family metal-dependent hydrolase